MYVIKSGRTGPITLCTLAGDGRFTYQELPRVIHELDRECYETFMYAGDDGTLRLHIVTRADNGFFVWRVTPPSELTYIFCDLKDRSVTMHINVNTITVGAAVRESYVQLCGDLLYVSLPTAIVCMNLRTMHIVRVIDHMWLSNGWKFMVVDNIIYVLLTGYTHAPMDGIVFVSCPYDAAISSVPTAFEWFSRDTSTLYMKVGETRYSCIVNGMKNIECGPADEYDPPNASCWNPLCYIWDGTTADIRVGERLNGRFAINGTRLVIEDIAGDVYRVGIEAHPLDDSCHIVG